MKKIVSFAASLLLVAGSLASCGKNNDDEPIEIPFTKYSLVGTNCDWNTIEMDKVIIINSYEELEKYITCTDGLYPDVDFSENTLLLVGRTIPGLVKSFTASFLKKSTYKYTLNVKVLSDMSLYMLSEWHICIFVPKMPNNAIITLNVETHSTT